MPPKRSLSPAGSKRKRAAWKMRSMLVVVGLTLGIVAAEAALQLVSIPDPAFPLYTPDRFVGTILLPNQEGWYTREGRAYVRVNHQGLRDIEHAPAKPAKTYRVAVLGDSFAEALQVDRKDTFWTVMQREFSACLPEGYDRIEVLNFGISGYGTAQELLMLRHYVWRFDPDLVLLAFLPANDIRNNSKELEQQNLRPYFFLDGDQLVLDDSFRHDPVRQKFEQSAWIQFKDWLIRKSQLCALVYRLRHYRQQQHAREGQRQIEAGLSAPVYHRPRSDAWKRAWTITERLLVQMHKEVAERGIPFVVLSVTSGVVVNPEDAPREELCRELGVRDLLYPDRWLERLGKKSGFPVVLLSESMQAHAKKHNVYFHGFENTQPGTGHWNEQGHHFAGRRAAEAICRVLSSERRVAESGSMKALPSSSAASAAPSR